ncbi:ATP-binding protein [Lachnospiraceae bacterium 54-53]
MSRSKHLWGSNLLRALAAAALVALCAYSGPLWKRCTFAALFAALCGLVEMFSLLGAEIWKGTDVTCMTAAFMLAKAAMLPLIMGIRYFMKKKGLGKESCGQGLFLILPMVAAMTVYYAFYMTVEAAGPVNKGILGWLLLGTAAMILLNLSIYPAYVRRAEEAQIKKNESIYIKQLELYRKQRKLENEEAVELHTKRHDLKQKLIYIHELAVHEEKEKLMEILAEMIGETGKREGMEGRTGNLVVDALVNHLCAEARLKGIRLYTKINLPGELNIDDTDLCILQGNAFDNAVEALEFVEEECREMWLEMKYERGCLLLHIRNRYTGELEVEGNGLLKSRKKDGMHGFGLRSMKKVVGKYNGILVTEGKDGIFTLRAMLYEPYGDQLQNKTEHM